ncbi:MAG: sporulation protein YabP [Clostridia bacterium]|nr:sporulation protein YabP [Clostridia bacterium]
MEEKLQSKRVHNMILEGRKKLVISGVTDVGSYDDRTVTASTELGELTIKGEGLNITRLSVETGDMNVEGKISSLDYTDDLPKTAGFFARMFR